MKKNLGSMVAGLAALAGLVGCGGNVSGGDGRTNDGSGTSVEAITSGKCPSGPTVPGVDVSSWQGGVNWGAVAASGQKFAIARVSDGSYIDQDFAGNWAGMRAAGLIRGAYQFFEPGEDAVAQANEVIARVGHLGAGDLPVMLDMEVTGGQSPATITAKIHQWVNAITAGTGKATFIYTGAYFWDDNVGSYDFSGLRLDVAWYGTNCPGVPNAWAGPGWTIHQYASTGSVPGISGNVDMNIFNGTLAQLQAWAGENLAPIKVACGLNAGDVLHPGESKKSCNGRSELVLQTDGNLVLYSTSPSQALWSTGTYGKGSTVAAMQTDGNFVVYAGSTPVWNSRTSGNPGSALAVQDDGNLVLYAPGPVALWDSATFLPVEVACGLNAGQSLSAGQSTKSCDGRFTLAMQTDGNFVLYEGGTALWNTRTNGKGGNLAVMQADGNLVVYASGRPIWNTGTFGHTNSALALQNDGNLVIYAPGNKVLWDSHTAGH